MGLGLKLYGSNRNVVMCECSCGNKITIAATKTDHTGACICVSAPSDVSITRYRVGDVVGGFPVRWISNGHLFSGDDGNMKCILCGTRDNRDVCDGY